MRTGFTLESNKESEDKVVKGMIIDKGNGVYISAEDFYRLASDKYYRLLDGSDEIVTYAELELRLESQGTYDCYVTQEIEDLIDSGCLEGLSEDEAKPIWEEQQRRMKRCTDCAYLEGGEHGEWICGLDGKCVIQIEYCGSVEKPSLLSEVYTEDDLKEMGL